MGSRMEPGKKQFHKSAWKQDYRDYKFFRELLSTTHRIYKET